MGKEQIFFEEFKGEADSSFYSQGASPNLLEKLIAYLDSRKIKELYVSLYLFNNVRLYKKLLELARKGTKVTIVSIPLEGYDGRNPQYLTGFNSGDKSGESYTKKDLAKGIYEDLKAKACPNIDFYIFPHVYVRSKNIKKFSRGALPYSLHIKSLYIVEENSESLVISSSNLAVRDLRKFDLLYIHKVKKAEAAKSFYHTLIRNSIPFESYKPVKDVNYPVSKVSRFPSSGNHFTAPFYKNSNRDIEEKIIKDIRNAKRRIIICAQHLSAYNYSYFSKGKKFRKGILGEAVDRDSIEVTYLSQTYGLKSKGVRSPKNYGRFKEFAKAVKQSENASYYVNRHVHSKFIIIDDKAYITTANFTPTQFIYIPDIHIKKFKNLPGLSYKGIHSEVSVFSETSDKEVINKLFKHIDFIKKHKATCRVK